MKKTTYFIVIGFFILRFFNSQILSAQAWAGPYSAPPDGNPTGFLNTSSVNQKKGGGLHLGATPGTVIGAWIDNGIMVVGAPDVSANPGPLAYIGGDILANRICLGTTATCWDTIPNTDGGGSIVTGGGTKNRIPRWSITGSSLVDSSIIDNGTTITIGPSGGADFGLYTDIVTGNTSIGANSAGGNKLLVQGPTWLAGDTKVVGNTGIALDVDGVSAAPATSGSAANGLARFGDAATGNVVLDVGVESSLGYSWLQARNKSSYAAKFPLALNPTGGNVGIGTTNPGAKLEVAGGGLMVRGIFTEQLLNGFNESFRLATDNHAAISFRDPDLPGGLPLFFGMHQNGTFYWGKGERSGSSNKAGSTYLMWLSNGGGLNIFPTAEPAIQVGNNGSHELKFVNSGAANIYQSAFSQPLYLSANVAPVYIGGTPDGQHLTVSSSGNVGIGTTDPGAKLDVVGKLRAQEFCMPKSDGTNDCRNSWADITGSNHWKLASNGADIYNNNTGNIGIGIAAPLGKLDVWGVGSGRGIRTNPNDAGYVLSSYNSSATGAEQFNIKHNLGNVEIRNERGNIGFTAGNVGIGTTDPGAKLDVRGGNARINNVFLGDVGHGASWAGFAHADAITSSDQSQNKKNYAFLQNGNGQYALVNKKSNAFGTLGHIGFRIDNVDKMIIDNDGNVGIGTTNTSAAKLTVDGTVRITGGNPSAGKVLTSDDYGIATWQTPSGGKGSITSVTASAPLASSGGTAPNISFTGTLGVANGGTGVTTAANNTVLMKSSTGVVSWGTALPAVSGSDVTSLNGSNITTGTVAPLRLGSGTPGTGNYLRGDGTWASPAFTLEDGSVTTPKLATDAVTGIKIKDGEVSSADIKNLTIASDDIADGAVAFTKIEAPAATCTDGKVLKRVNGAWACADDGGASATSGTDWETAIIWTKQPDGSFYIDPVIKVYNSSVLASSQEFLAYDYRLIVKQRGTGVNAFSVINCSYSYPLQYSNLPGYKGAACTNNTGGFPRYHITRLDDDSFDVKWFTKNTTYPDSNVAVTTDFWLVRKVKPHDVARPVF